MSDAAKVQQRPVTTPESRDVFEDLLKQTDFAGRMLISDVLEERLAARIDYGERKYGSRLKTNNGRDVLLDIEQELLDGVQYSHQGVMQGHRVAHIRNALIKAAEALAEYRRITEQK
ncbi:Uncharacterised protein [uncultured archaeon]|nr:Uncharacterised protein [uncultured archaeon]